MFMLGLNPSPDQYANCIESLQQSCPQARIVGSIGRSVVFGTIGDPNMEFVARRLPPLGSTEKPRDIDVLGLPNTYNADRNTAFIDLGTPNNAFGRVVHVDGDQWSLVSERHGFEELLHPDVMAPYTGKGIFGINIITVRPETLLALYVYRGRPRAKDKFTSAFLSNQLGIYELDEQQYAPFLELGQLNYKDAYIRARSFYWKALPEEFRTKISKMCDPIKNSAIKLTGK